MKRASIVLLGSLAVSACGSSTVKTVQSNKSVQQVELQVEQQVSKCIPTSGGAPDPLALRRSAERSKFVTCTGLVKDAKVFESCAFKVLFGGLPTVAGVQKGLTACVEKAA